MEKNKIICLLYKTSMYMDEKKKKPKNIQTFQNIERDFKTSRKLS